MLKLAGLRIRDICERLDFDPLDRETIMVQVSGALSHVSISRPRDRFRPVSKLLSCVP